jgi:hypothetical protein
MSGVLALVESSYRLVESSHIGYPQWAPNTPGCVQWGWFGGWRMVESSGDLATCVLRACSLGGVGKHTQGTLTFGPPIQGLKEAELCACLSLGGVRQNEGGGRSGVACFVAAIFVVGVDRVIWRCAHSVGRKRTWRSLSSSSRGWLEWTASPPQVLTPYMAEDCSTRDCILLLSLIPSGQACTVDHQSLQDGHIYSRNSFKQPARPPT